MVIFHSYVNLPEGKYQPNISNLRKAPGNPNPKKTIHPLTKLPAVVRSTQPNRMQIQLLRNYFILITMW